MLARIRFSAAIFGLAVAVSSAALSALGVLIVASVAKPSESIVGLGFLWILSLPAIAMLAACTTALFPRYASREGFAAQLAFYLPLIVMVALVAPVLTYFGYPLVAAYLE